MVATVILGMLCVHLLCFSTMFLLISKRLDGNRMGMEVFALGNLLLGVAYALQLVGGVANHRAIGFINHTMTLGAPVAYALGAARFFNRPVPVLRPCWRWRGCTPLRNYWCSSPWAHRPAMPCWLAPARCFFWRWWWRCFMACARSPKTCGPR